MSYDITFPKLSASDASAQLRGYLYRLVEQLNYALNAMDASTERKIVQQISSQTASGAVKTPEEQAQATFNSMKALIITSADIVNAYYEEINKKLEGVYVAQSDFGTFRDETKAFKQETSAFTSTTYSRLQSVESAVKGVEDMLRATKAYIKTGLLVDGLSSEEAEKYGMKEGDSLYGIEVGQENYDENGNAIFDKFARFTANRLSFYDQNGTEVAYISDYKLHITSAEIIVSIKLGGYKLDTTDGLAFRWEGVIS